MADYYALIKKEFPDAVVIAARDGRILHWNSGAERIFGFTREEAVGQNVIELLVPPDYDAEERRAFEETLAKGEATVEGVRRRKDGQLMYVAISNKVLRDPDSGELLILSSKKDVTHLKLKRETHQVEARFRDVLESTPDGIVMVNTTGNVVFANSHAERLFGYEHGELRGKSVELLLPARLRSAHLGHRARYLTQPRVRAMGAGLELFGLRKDGSEFPVEISLSPLRMDDMSLVISAIRDISDRKRIEQELREKNEALENASRAKDRFLASMSHELRTPLNAVIGFTGTLLMKLPGPLNDEQERQLRTVQTSARHLLSLINDLLDVARIEANRQELRLEPLDCREIVAEVAETLRPLAEKKALCLTVELPPEPLTLRCDRRALSQIVINLAGNAIKFTERGSVRISVCRREKPQGKSTVEIAVADTGQGIRPEDQRKLFEPFSRLDPDDNRIVPGTGLGLHLSRKLAGLLGGNLTLESEYGRGTVFTLVLQEN